MFLVFWNLFFFFQRAQSGETREGFPGSKPHHVCVPVTPRAWGAAHRVPLCVPQQPTLHAVLVAVPKTPWDAWPMLLRSCSQDTALPAGTVLSTVSFLLQVGLPFWPLQGPPGSLGPARLSSLAWAPFTSRGCGQALRLVSHHAPLCGWAPRSRLFLSSVRTFGPQGRSSTRPCGARRGPLCLPGSKVPAGTSVSF